MTSDQELLKHIDISLISKVEVRNREYLDVRGKGAVAIESLMCLKLIVDILFVHDLDQTI